jgi:hypothetical protein
MTSITTIFLSVIFLISCNSSNKKADSNDRVLLEDPEHQIKDSPKITKHDSTILYTGWYYIVGADNGYKRQLDKSTETYFIDNHPIVTVKNFTTLEIYESDSGGKKYVGLTMRLDEKGAENWSIATEKSIGGYLAFILDDRLLYVAKVNSQITVGVTALNRGDYTRQELENFKTIIESEK